VVLCALVACAALDLVGCEQADEPSCSASKESDASVLVEVVRPAAAGHSGRSIEVAGTVEPFRRAPLAFKVGGRVAHVAVELGDRVQAGDSLARLELRDLRIAVREAEAAVKAARAGLTAAKHAGSDLAGKELARARQLADAGGASPAILDQAEAQVRAADAKLLEAQAGLQRARALKDRALSAVADASLKAPFNAVVVHKAVEQGQIVGPGVPAFVLENVDQVRILASIPAVDLPAVDQQAPVAVRVSEAGDTILQGRIRALGWAGDPATGTFPVEVLVDNPDHQLRSGMAAWVDLPRLSAAGGGRIFTVPLTAVVSRGRGGHVFVVHGEPDARARRVTVELHGFEGDSARVTGDLDSSSRVVVKGQLDLDHGKPVRVAEAAGDGGGRD
jgi:RND family efflux transporter MFP subunit